MGHFGMMELGMEKMEQVSGREIGETSSQASEVVRSSSSAVQCSAVNGLSETGMDWSGLEWTWGALGVGEPGGIGGTWQALGGKERRGRAS